MEIRLFLLAGLVLAIAAVALRRRTPKRLPPLHRWRHRVAIQEGDYPYFPKKTLLTKSEREFYRVLQAVVGERFTIAMSVRLADVINCSREAWTKGHGALISAKQLDFVLCEPETTRIVLAIELDDPTHQLADRSERDRFLNNAMGAAGVPLLRVPTAPRYDEAGLRIAISQAIGGRRSTTRAA
jgi:hypothetical protein